RGAIGVVELDRIGNLEALRARFVEEGVFVRPFGSIIYLTPAFTIGTEDLATLTAAVTKIGRADWDRLPRREARDKRLKIRQPCRADRIRRRARSAPLQSRLSAGGGGLSRARCRRSPAHPRACVPLPPPCRRLTATCCGLRRRR